MIKEIDAAIARRLFHPPIILLCQLTGQTQYAIYRAGWFFAMLWSFWTNIGWAQVIMGVCAIIQMLAATFAADVPTKPSPMMRAFLYGMLPLDILSLLGGKYGIVYTILALIAEYARTIETIPPRSTREVRKADYASQS